VQHDRLPQSATLGLHPGTHSYSLTDPVGVARWVGVGTQQPRVRLNLRHHDGKSGNGNENGDQTANTALNLLYTTANPLSLLSKNTYLPRGNIFGIDSSLPISNKLKIGLHIKETLSFIVTVSATKELWFRWYIDDYMLNALLSAVEPVTIRFRWYCLHNR